NTYRDGVLTMTEKGHIYFPSIRARDMVIRAQVHVPRGNGVHLMLRERDDANYLAVFGRNRDGTSRFGFGRTARGKFNFLKGFQRKDATYPDDEFVEFRFAVVGNMLTIHVNGQKMVEIWDATHEDKAGSPGIQVAESGSRFKDIEVKVLKE